MLTRSFYHRNPATVAQELLGKFMRHDNVRGIIVETEAYFGPEDPASRAKKRTRISEVMWGKGGLAMVYMVHANWLFNVTADKEGVPGAVLVRAVEPVEGIDLMKERRGVSKAKELTSGPGKLTQAMRITGDFHGVDLMEQNALKIEDGGGEFEIGRSHRIGVREDMDEELRFYVVGSDFVSR